MTFPASAYIEERNGGLYITGTRVSLDSVVIRFRKAHLRTGSSSRFRH
jgi:hypothetical protein